MRKTSTLNMNRVMDIGGLISGALILNKIHGKLQNDIQRKSLLEDLHMNDPVLKNVDKAQLLEWYATIMHFAPRTSLDKTAVREILQNFARFGKADIQTLTMLAETEKNMESARSNMTSWGSLFGDLARGVGGAIG